MRPVVFHPAAIAAIRRFPKDVREPLGRALFLLQMGEALTKPLSRPMPGIQPGAAELRIPGADGTSRTFYYTASTKGVLVFHAFRQEDATDSAA